MNIRDKNLHSKKAFSLYGEPVASRLLLGTAGYPSPAILADAVKASGADVVTVSLRRESAGGQFGQRFLEIIKGLQVRVLPNTAGCRTAREAITTAEMARELFGTDWIKLEVIGDPVTLLPDNEQTLEAARILVKEGFKVLPYFSDDLIMAKKLLDAGCPAVMPLAAPIGSGLGVQNPASLKIMREQLPDATIIVDAGVGVPSDAAIAMELGADAILMNTAIAESRQPEQMAAAMKLAVQAGRLAYLAGRMPKRLYASASSPIEGAIK